MKPKSNEDTIKDIEKTLFQHSTVLSSINTTLNDMKEAIKDVIEIARSQAKQEERIANKIENDKRIYKNFSADISKLYELVDKSQCSSHEERLKIVEKRSERNAATDSAQDARAMDTFKQILLAILAAGLGGGIAWFLK